MNEQITALIAQENAAQYFKRIERIKTFGLQADISVVLVRMQERVAHHAAIARAALGIE